MPLRNVALPFFSKVQDDVRELRRSLLLNIRMAATLAFPALALLGGAAPVLLAVIGENWVVSSDALRLLCLTGVAGVILFLSPVLLTAVGRPWVAAGMSWFLALVNLVSWIVWGLVANDKPVEIQLLGFAVISVCVHCFLWLPIVQVVLRKTCGVTLNHLLREMVPASVAALLALLALLVASSIESLGELPVLIRAFITVLPASLLSLGTIMMLEPRIKSRLKRWRAADSVTDSDMHRTP